VKRAIPGPDANRAAFLDLERERRVFAARLRRTRRRRSAHYRDLVLITKLIRLEYEHLVGRIGRRTELQSLPDGPPTLGEDTPAVWAKPWGVGPMFELRAHFIHYEHKRDRLAKRLSPATRASAEADAERRLDRISVISSRFAWVIDEGRPEVEDERVEAPESDKKDPRPLMKEAAGEETAAEEGKPWASQWFTWAAATFGVVLVVAGIDAGVRSGGHPDSASAPSGSVASVPEPPLASLGDRPREPQPAPRLGVGQDAPRRSTVPEQRQNDASRVQSASPQGNQTASAGSDASPPASEPTAEASPTPTPTAAPVATPAPAPATASATAAQQEFGFEN
jgi:hypothetical protein